MGCLFFHDITEYKWYGQHVGDYPIPEGMTKEQLGKCSHVIRLPGCDYEIGVVKLPNGKWTLAYDFWGPGRKLLEKFGDKLGKLIQCYGVHKVTREARRNGKRVSKTIDIKGYVHLKIS